MSKLRIGIIGAGGTMAAHGPALLKMKSRCDVVAVAEPKADLAPRIHSMFDADVFTIWTT